MAGEPTSPEQPQPRSTVPGEPGGDSPKVVGPLGGNRYKYAPGGGKPSGELKPFGRLDNSLIESMPTDPGVTGGEPHDVIRVQSNPGAPIEAAPDSTIEVATDNPSAEKTGK